MQQHTIQQDAEIAQKPVPVIVRQISIKSAQISWISDHNEVIISVKYQNFQMSLLLVGEIHQNWTSFYFPTWI